MGSVLMSERSLIGLSDLQSLLKINDDYYDCLTDLFEKLQLATYEASDMMLDFMTFVNSVRYFAVITRDSYKTYMYRESSKEPARGNPPPHDCGTKECHTAKDIVGMIYLTMPSESRNNTVGVNDLNIGLIIHPQYRRKGYATQAIQLVLDHAFKTIRCHRVQAIIMNPFTRAKYASYRLFASIGFRQEGIRRCSYFNPFEYEYQDIAYMAILDTEWLTTLRSTVPRMTPWDEVLRRHEQERETIMRWEERTGDADETETVHQFALGAGESASEAASSSGEQSEPSRETSRATSPDFYTDSASVTPYTIESLSSGPSSQAPSERSDSPLSPVDLNWDLMDDDIADIPEGVL